MTDKPERGLPCSVCWPIAWEEIDGELRCAACFYRDQADHYRKQVEEAERQSGSLAQTLDDVYKARDALAKRVAALEPLLDRLSDLLISADDGDVDCGACSARLARPNGYAEEHRSDCPVALAAALLRKE